MPVLRSREIIFKSPLKTLENPPPPLANPPPPPLSSMPLDPPTPGRSDGPPPPSSPSSALGSPPPRRRSLRLASLSTPSRVSSSPAIEKYGEKAGKNLAGEARVSQPAVLPQNDEKTGASDVAVDPIPSLSSKVGVTGEERSSYDEKGKGELVSEKIRAADEMVVDDTSAVSTSNRDRVDLKRKFSAEEKGKGKLVVENDEDLFSADKDEGMLDEGPVIVGEIGEHLTNHGNIRLGIKLPESRRVADKKRAISLAPKFAFFKPEEEEEEEEDGDEDQEESILGAGKDDKDWPGPISTAMRIIDEREAMRRARELNSAYKKDESIEMKIQWTPSKEQKCQPRRKRAPSLKELCLKTLAENAEEIESLEGLPDVLKNTLMSLLCHSRKMSVHVLGIITSGSPAKVQLNDCSWATEEEMQRVFTGCNTENLKVLQLDMCGRCMSDYVLSATLARSPNCLPSLATLSLKGAYRLTDDGLNAIAASAPLLSSINLGQCSLITSNGIISLADKLGSVLRELYIDDCNVDPIFILPALKKILHLEVLSVARIQSVNDKFVKALISFSGQNMRELVFSECRKLTSASMKIIGGKCSHLCALDLQCVNRLNDSALGYITNGCRLIKKFKLRRNGFSDEAIAAFLEASGDALTELSLNNVAKVGQRTAVAISRNCSSSLNTLDLSFCRQITDEALGLIVDSCSCLKVLKLFGCTQVTDVFLEGHSNSQVEIIGLKGLLLQQIEMPEFL